MKGCSIILWEDLLNFINYVLQISANFLTELCVHFGSSFWKMYKQFLHRYKLMSSIVILIRLKGLFSRFIYLVNSLAKLGKKQKPQNFCFWFSYCWPNIHKLIPSHSIDYEDVTTCKSLRLLWKLSVEFFPSTGFAHGFISFIFSLLLNTDIKLRGCRSLV